MIRHISLRTALHKLLALAKRTMKNGRPASEEPVVRQKIAALSIGERVLQLNGYRSLTKILRGGAPGRRARPPSSSGACWTRSWPSWPPRSSAPTRRSRRAARTRPTRASGSSTACSRAAAASAPAPPRSCATSWASACSACRRTEADDGGRAVSRSHRSSSRCRPLGCRRRPGPSRSASRTISRTGPRRAGWSRWAGRPIRAPVNMPSGGPAGAGDNFLFLTALGGQGPAAGSPPSTSASGPATSSPRASPACAWISSTWPHRSPPPAALLGRVGRPGAEPGVLDDAVRPARGWRLDHCVLLHRLGRPDRRSRQRDRRAP